ncbi:MAG TPA: sugar ABC transporter permease [Phycisphaerae bacterium]|nr:sugar ABC transporter permease [Phycisphaerae bacterium]
MKIITFRQLRHLWPVYLLILPSLLLICTFSYYPAVSATYHAFYRWNGDEVSEWVGLANFERAFQDPVLGKAFVLVMMFIAANLVKMVPSIITAVVIHRLTSDRARYLYRVAFVIPMIIPGMVWLLLWKYFYDPSVGVLNQILDATGLMSALNWLDTAMPRLSEFLTPYVHDYLGRPFGSLWGFGLLGAVVLGFLGGFRGMVKGWLWWIALFVGAWFLWGPGAKGFSIAGVAWSEHFTGWEPWNWGFWSSAFWMEFLGSRVFVLGTGHAVFLLLACGIPAEFLRRTEGGRTALKWVGGGIIAVFAVLVLVSATWTRPIEAFGNPDSPPGWLAQPELIRPAIIFWGFPWVGVVSVLLYLSGLGNIDQSIYEAADIDGCGPIRKFWNIELPLIMTQIRLNLVLMIIGTLTGWGLVFILLGDTGGPEGVGMLPGLYMFHKAFTAAEVGYACAIGLLLFFLIVYLTVINNRYVRVSK